MVNLSDKDNNGIGDIFIVVLSEFNNFGKL